MELAKADYTNETELSAAREMLERRDTELTRLREEMEALRTVNHDNALMLDDIRLPFFKLLKDQLGAMVSGEIAEQLKTNETVFDIQDHMDEIRDEIYHNLDITDFQNEIEEMVSERDITEEVSAIVEDCLRTAKITIS